MKSQRRTIPEMGCFVEVLWITPSLGMTVEKYIAPLPMCGRGARGSGGVGKMKMEAK